jgi:predicted nuclease with TOPRIM domain
MDPYPDETEALRATVRDLQERLGVLTGLEERLRVAEARAVDAERRLQELSDQVEAADRVRGNVESPPQTARPPETPSSEADDLRARLARTASRKKAGGADR